MASLESLTVGDPPELWSDLGFAVRDGACLVGPVAIEFGGPGEGVLGWALSGVGDLTELPLLDRPAGLPEPSCCPSGLRHPNGVEVLDHVVVSTPDLDRTVAAFEAAGVPLRRVRDIGNDERPLAQAFFKVVGAVVEVVGPPGLSGLAGCPGLAGRPNPGLARFYGLAFTVSDLDATARLLGDRLRPAKDAVQPGRRIATLDRGAGSTVPMAFMSQRP